MNLVRREREIGFGLARPEYLGCDIATERRTVLEAMAGAAADDPAIAPCGVPIDQHVAVVAIFILADFGRRQRAPGEGGESLRQIGADIGQPLFGHPPVRALGSLSGAMPVQRDLETARLASGAPIIQVGVAGIDPTRPNIR